MRKYTRIFIMVVLGFISLQLIYILFFKGASPDMLFVDCAKNILKGKLALPTQGDIYGFNKYFLGYPFLNSFFISLVFRIFGSSYEVAAIIPIIFALFNILLIYYYCARYIGRIEAIIASSLLMFDPMFFSFASVARPEMVTLFFFTFSALLYFRAEKGNDLVKVCLSGALAGLAMLSSINSFWLVIIFFIHKIWKKDLFGRWKANLLYIFGCLVTSLPYYLWILLNKERFNIFKMQLFINSSYWEAEKIGALAYLAKSILNPLADMYLIFFRHHSFFPFILGLVILFFIFMQDKFRYLLCVLIVPLFMMTVNIRAGHYLLIIMPVGMIGLAYALKHLRELHLPSISLNRYNSILTRILFIILLINFSFDIAATFRKPDFKIDIAYFKNLLEENTEDSSRIVTDIAFTLTDISKREIFNISLLVYFPYRRLYSFNEIAASLDMDYIILTEQKYNWVMSDDSQNDEFKNFLKKEFVLIKFIDEPEHGKFWIYARKSKEFLYEKGQHNHSRI